VDKRSFKKITKMNKRKEKKRKKKLKNKKVAIFEIKEFTMKKI
jgi:hypothetical protein